jgi:hypothetical protein
MRDAYTYIVEMSEEKRVRIRWEKNTESMYLKAKCF